VRPVRIRLALLFLALVVAAGVGLLLGRATSPEASSPPATRTFTVRQGDVVSVPRLGVHCQASQEGGAPNLFCEYFPSGAHQVVFYDDGAYVYQIGYPDYPRVFARREAALPVDVDLSAIEIGAYRADTTPTLREVIEVFGPPDTCSITPVAKYASARWHVRGLTITAGRLGPIPGGRDPCHAPRHVFVSDLRLTGRRWRTAEGLRIGDSNRLVEMLYPYARRRPDGWWLVVDLSHETQFVPVALLRAETSRGKVTAFVIHVGGEGI
jgi:hypothetical protein